MEFTKREEQNITRGFYVSVIVKGIISMGEIIVGILAVFVPVSSLANILVQLPTNFITLHALSILNELAHVSGIFISLYLLSRGLVKVLLILGMLKSKLWAYPASLAVIGAFLLYQVYQIATTHSIAIVALTIFDLVVMWFVYEEYQVLKSKDVTRSEPLR